jgi:hypothetical protein
MQFERVLLQVVRLRVSLVRAVTASALFRHPEPFARQRDVRCTRSRLQRLQSRHDASRIMARNLAARFS